MANRRDIIRRFSTESGLPLADATRLVDLLFTIIQDAVWHEGEAKLPGFGTFRVKQRKGFEATHPADQEVTISIPARETVTFRASANWRTR